VGEKGGATAGMAVAKAASRRHGDTVFLLEDATASVHDARAKARGGATQREAARRVSVKDVTTCRRCDDGHARGSAAGRRRRRRARRANVDVHCAGGVEGSVWAGAAC
jgi:hypothetical protein